MLRTKRGLRGKYAKALQKGYSVRVLKEDGLEDVYGFEAYLQAKHPENHNVKAKVRQQLLFLRDRGAIEFVGRGRYRVR